MSEPFHAFGHRPFGCRTNARALRPSPADRRSPPHFLRRASCRAPAPIMFRRAKVSRLHTQNFTILLTLSGFSRQFP
ncbi:hypothetical protein CWD85_31530 [Burkholderia pseudomallei]|nr:hypothetical protein BOC38_01185 [Burkholderia pseudomallei]ARM01680.1 hypothetical protein BOC59_17910 [Burkholderia pseudomallei]AYE26849.1 hypothetical protein CNX72_04955 [Burkholderia pseudomallei]PJO55650.1 hypothetical protein CWD85_31530 [Burkholderia pseudomallei]